MVYTRPVDDYKLKNIPVVKTVKILSNVPATLTIESCRTHSCLNVFRCHADQDWTIKVYLYPEINYVNEDGVKIFPDTSIEFEKIRTAIKASKYWTDNFTQACVLVPNVDILSENALLIEEASKVLSSLPLWNEGRNHLIFNMFPDRNKFISSNVNTPLSMNTGKAMIASAGFNNANHRAMFDISIPVFNSLSAKPSKDTFSTLVSKHRKWLLAIAGGHLRRESRITLEQLIERNKRDILPLSFCPEKEIAKYTNKRCNGQLVYNYPKILEDSVFCFVLPSNGLGQTFLLDALMSGCIPVLLSDKLMLPFSDVLDWERASITVNANDLETLVYSLKKINSDQVRTKRRQALFLWDNYFSSLHKITITALDIINERVFPHKAKSYEGWNGLFGTFTNNVYQYGTWSPLYLPIMPASKEGYTAVILTYNRVNMLFTLMKRLSLSPSLSKIIVVWNNLRKNPPKESAWPKLDRPWTVIRSKTNRLSNRFYPYKEIETEAVLAIDDDILMLTIDEIEFAYSTWQHYSDRLVGFPGRYHMLDSIIPGSTKDYTFKYQSEWNNDISMVLTGAAFHHKIYSHWYTYMLPSEIQNYVDEKMNCEDIAMNFLVSNLTRKAPVKVTPRKRFKCSQCGRNESLWSETSHFVKRSECLRYFTKQFNYMPLKAVEFRLDPSLYKEDVSQTLKFREIGLI